MSIFVSIKRDDRLIIRFDYTKERVKKIRSIVGRSWNQRERYWAIPFQHESVKSFYDLFGTRHPWRGRKEFEGISSHL